jgi:regulator of sirC expression with transglutaminase-like and TPR domain
VGEANAVSRQMGAMYPVVAAGETNSIEGWMKVVTLPASSPRRQFALEVDRPDDQVGLARAALLVAQEEYPQLPVEPYLTRLDVLAEEVKDRLADETAPVLVLQELLDTLFLRNSFQGNREAYYDPRNSFLNDVLDRRRGIPLTLGMVVLEVGWRLDLPLSGVNFPGHFLVRFEGEEIRLLLDPFDGGRVRFEDEAQDLLDRVYGGMVRVQPAFLRPASRRDMLVRLLTNLKGVYLNARDHQRALAAVDRILLIHPTAPSEIRDRGTLLARMGRTEEALEQLEWYLDYAPEAADAGRIRILVEELRTTGGESAGRRGHRG